MEKKLLKFDLQSIVCVISFIISGMSFASFLKNDDIGLLLIFLSTTITGIALILEIYRKRKKEN